MTQESANQDTEQDAEAAAPNAYPVMLTLGQESAAHETEMTEALRHLARLVAENGLSELTVVDEGVTLTVKATFEAAPVLLPHMTSVQAYPHILPLAQTPAYSETAVTAPVAPAAPVTTVALESPMVGVFYRSPSPEDPPFVSVGDFVRVGQPIGLIEAMKVYSEVLSEVSGRVTETPVESGKLVQQGQPLIVVEPQ